MRVLRQCLLLALYLWEDTVVSGGSCRPFARPWLYALVACTVAALLRPRRPYSRNQSPIVPFHSPSTSPFQSGVSGPAYLMVLPVFRRIHWGMGLFCFWALASFCLVRNDLWDCRRG
jgi:hypothetical protein